MKLPVPVGAAGRRRAFPLAAPSWPAGVSRPPVEDRTGINYDTAWSRRYGARLARALVVDGVLGPLVRALASPRVEGLDRIADLDAPAVFAANHQSHLDTSLLLTCLPPRFRHRTVVAAAADYFFTTRARGAVSALGVGAIPFDRRRVGRRSSDLAAELIDDGWSLVIFPEGGRSPDGWARDFRGGAAYLGVRCRRPVVPVYVEGTRRVLARGARWPTPAWRPFGVGGRASRVSVLFGPPLRAEDGEDTRRFASRVEAAVAALADEKATDWWSARRRAARGTTPPLTGPGGAAWRRAWALDGGGTTSIGDDERRWP